MTAPTVALAADVRDRFRADHAQLEALLEKTRDAFQRNDRDAVAQAWAELDARLLTHMDAEERYMIAALNRSDARAARALIEEHRHLRTRLTEIGTAVDLHIARLETFRQFQDELRAHARHEDGALYLWSDEHLDEGDRVSAIAALLNVVRARRQPARRMQ